MPSFQEGSSFAGAGAGPEVRVGDESGAPSAPTESIQLRRGSVR